eukprot:12931057-Prorocentrum_lima.AAC.1
MSPEALVLVEKVPCLNLSSPATCTWPLKMSMCELWFSGLSSYSRHEGGAGMAAGIRCHGADGATPDLATAVV